MEPPTAANKDTALSVAAFGSRRGRASQDSRRAFPKRSRLIPSGQPRLSDVSTGRRTRYRPHYTTLHCIAQLPAYSLRARPAFPHRVVGRVPCPDFPLSAHPTRLLSRRCRPLPGPSLLYHANANRPGTNRPPPPACTLGRGSYVRHGKVPNSHLITTHLPAPTPLLRRDLRSLATTAIPSPTLSHPPI